MSDTPRTDAARQAHREIYDRMNKNRAWNECPRQPWSDHVGDECEKLERELNELRRALNRVMGCPPDCADDDYPGCGICMMPAASLIEFAMSRKTR